MASTHMESPTVPNADAKVTVGSFSGSVLSNPFTCRHVYYNKRDDSPKLFDSETRRCDTKF